MCEMDLTYTPLVIRKVSEGTQLTSKLFTAAEGPIPAGNALHEFKKNCDGQVELLACLTMYNEDFELFCHSVSGVLRNYAELIEVSPLRYRGRVAIVCIADGYDKLDQKFLSAVSSHNLIDEKLLEDEHCFVKIKKKDGQVTYQPCDFEEMGVLLAEPTGSE